MIKLKTYIIYSKTYLRRSSGNQLNRESNAGIGKTQVL